VKVGATVAEDWVRVGKAIADRIEELSLTVAEIDRRGVSDKTLKAYIAGQPIRRADKRRALCEVLGWTPRSIGLVAAGGDPEPVTPSAAEVAALRAEVAELRRRVERLDSAPGDPR
jgi:hypothetical protein